ATRSRSSPNYWDISITAGATLGDCPDVSVGTFGIRHHFVDASVSLVAAFLDVLNSDYSVRGAARRIGLLPTHLSAAGIARDHRKTDGQRLPVGRRRALERERQ